jgi:hypothetical protein
MEPNLDNFEPELKDILTKLKDNNSDELWKEVVQKSQVVANRLRSKDGEGECNTTENLWRLVA